MLDTTVTWTSRRCTASTSERKAFADRFLVERPRGGKTRLWGGKIARGGADLRKHAVGEFARRNLQIALFGGQGKIDRMGALPQLPRVLPRVPALIGFTSFVAYRQRQEQREQRNERTRNTIAPTWVASWDERSALGATAIQLGR
jgi:hypothetical protein